MNIRPLQNYVLVKLERAKDKETDSGLVIPETTSANQETAEVLAVGPGKVFESGATQFIDLKVGDKVLFKSYNLDQVKFGEEEFGMVLYDDIMGVIND